MLKENTDLTPEYYEKYENGTQAISTIFGSIFASIIPLYLGAAELDARNEKKELEAKNI